MCHFKQIESYKHRLAKDLLSEWLSHEYLRIDKEAKFCEQGDILFIADLACYSEGGLSAIYEICHRHSLDGKKLSMIQYYQYVNNIDFQVYEVLAETILIQIEKPKYIKKFDFTTKLYDENEQEELAF